MHHLLTKLWDSRHFQQAQYTVFEEESDVQVKNKKFRHTGTKHEEKQQVKIYAFITVSSFLFVPARF